MLKQQRGLTLIELIISVVLLGIIIAATAPLISSAFTYIEAAKKQEVSLQNRVLSKALIDIARGSPTQADRGRLPAPATFTSGGDTFRNSIYNPGATGTQAVFITERIQSAGVELNRINTDGSAQKYVRVYQRVTGLTYDMPLYATTGPRVQLTYDVGVIYATKCPQGSGCNTTGGASDPPGDSAQLTSAGWTTWTQAGNDYGAIALSSLDVQKTFLRATAGRMNMLAERFTTDFHNKIRLAAADSTQNFFPVNGGTLTLGPANATTNMGCRDGWYNLAATNVDILTQLGMDKSEQGVTAWGGVIDFCRDYDPALSGTHNSPPHYGALRMNRDATSAVAPTVLSNAVIITF